MSRRLTTVLRVAALQETVARGAVGAAQAVVREAERDCADARDRLAATALTGGSVPELLASGSTVAGRAAVVLATDRAVDEAATARDEALARWVELRRRQRLLEELHARQRADDEAARERAAQRLADDLSAGRRP